MNDEGRGQHGNVSEVVNKCEPFWALGKCDVLTFGNQSEPKEAEKRVDS